MGKTWVSVWDINQRQLALMFASSYASLRKFIRMCLMWHGDFKLSEKVAFKHPALKSFRMVFSCIKIQYG